MPHLDSCAPRWAEVDLDAIVHNFREIKRLVGPQVAVMAVVKADAYGLGAAVVARELALTGVEWLGVTTLEEGIEIREAGVETPILLFAPLLPFQIGRAVDYHLTPTIHTEAEGVMLARTAHLLGRPLRAQLKVETGMHRTGLSPGEAAMLAIALAQDPLLRISGIYTHLAAAMSRQNDDRAYTLQQYRKLMQVIDSLSSRGVMIPLRHISNSAAVLAYPELRLDLVRVGTLLYGQYPAPGLPRLLDLKDPWKVRARVLQVQELAAGGRIGYGRARTGRRRTRVAVVPLGFADGFRMEPASAQAGLRGLVKRWLQRRGWRRAVPEVRVAGRPAPVLGRPAMQLTMVDVTDIAEAQVGSLCELAIRRTSLGRSVPRVYLRQGRPWRARTLLGEEPLTGKELQLLAEEERS